MNNSANRNESIPNRIDPVISPKVLKKYLATGFLSILSGSFILGKFFWTALMFATVSALSTMINAKIINRTIPQLNTMIG